MRSRSVSLSGNGDQENDLGQVPGAEPGQVQAPIKKTKSQMQAAVDALKEKNNARKPTVKNKISELNNAAAVAGAPVDAATNTVQQQGPVDRMLNQALLIKERLTQYNRSGVLGNLDTKDSQ